MYRRRTTGFRSTSSRHRDMSFRIDVIVDRGRSPETLPRESWREPERVRDKTITILTRLLPQVADGFRAVLEGAAVFTSIDDAVSIRSSLARGYVATIPGLARKLARSRIFDRKNLRHDKLALAAIITPASRLGTARQPSPARRPGASARPSASARSPATRWWACSTGRTTASVISKAVLSGGSWLAPLLFADDDPEGARHKRKSPVQKAQPSESAKRTTESKTTPEGLPFQSMADLPSLLGSLTRNEVNLRGHPDGRFMVAIESTELQAQAFVPPRSPDFTTG